MINKQWYLKKYDTNKLTLMLNTVLTQILQENSFISLQNWKVKIRPFSEFFLEMITINPSFYAYSDGK